MAFQNVKSITISCTYIYWNISFLYKMKFRIFMLWPRAHASPVLPQIRPTNIRMAKNELRQWSLWWREMGGEWELIERKSLKIISWLFTFDPYMSFKYIRECCNIINFFSLFVNLTMIKTKLVDWISFWLISTLTVPFQLIDQLGIV